MLSQTAEHALRAVLYLARRGDRGPVPAEAIAEALGAPRNYLSKTLHALAKRGVVVGVRGPSGGFRLAVDPAELPVARIVDAFDASAERRVCLLGGAPCDGRHPCAAHANWQRVVAEVTAPLRHTTVAELLGSGGGAVVARSG